MVDYRKIKNSIGSNSGSSANDANIMFSFLDRARQRMAFDSSKSRAEDAISRVFGGYSDHILHKCHHHFDISEWKIDADSTRTLSDTMEDDVRDDIENRKKSEGLPDDCAESLSQYVWNGAYNHYIYAAYRFSDKWPPIPGIGLQSEPELLLVVELEGPVLPDAVKDNVEREISLDTARGTVRRQMISGNNPVMDTLYINRNPNSLVDKFCVGADTPVDLMWANEMVRYLDLHFAAIDSMEWRASPNSNWDKDDTCGMELTSTKGVLTNPEDMPYALPEPEDGDEDPYEDADFEDVFPEDEGN